MKMIVLVIFALFSLSCAQDWTSAQIKTPLSGGSLQAVYWLNSADTITSCDISGMVPQPSCTVSGHTVTIGSSTFETSSSNPPSLNVRGPGWFVPFQLWYTNQCSTMCVHGTCTGASKTCSCLSGWGDANCNTPVPVVTQVSSLFATADATTIRITGSNGLFGDSTSLWVRTNLRDCQQFVYIDAFNVVCTLRALGSRPSVGALETIQITHNGVYGSTNVAYVSSTNSLSSNEVDLLTYNGPANFLIKALWSNGEFDCGSSSCDQSFFPDSVVNQGGGWSGWKIFFNADRHGQSSVATNFKSSGSMLSTGGAVSPDDLNFYFGVNVAHEAGGKALVYIGQGHSGAQNNWWIGGRSISNNGGSFASRRYFINLDNGRQLEVLSWGINSFKFQNY